MGAGVAHHANKKRQEAYEQGADDQASAEEPQQQQEPPAPQSDVPTNDIEELAKLHASGALTDEEFAAAKAKALGI